MQTACSQNPFLERLEIELTVYKNDSVVLEELRIVRGGDSPYSSAGGYRLEILDGNGEKLFEDSYNLRFMMFSDPPEMMDFSTLYLKPEYTPEMKTIKLYHDEREIFSQEINLCDNDGVCNEHETFLSCPSDCPLDERDGICIKDRDGVCDPDCDEGADPDCGLGTTTAGTTAPTTISATTSIPVTTVQPTTVPTTIEPGKEEGLSGYLPYLLGAIALIAIIFFISKALQRSRKEQKSKEEEQKLRTWTEQQLRSGEDPELLKNAIEDQDSDPSMVDEIMKKL